MDTPQLEGNTQYSIQQLTHLVGILSWVREVRVDRCSKTSLIERMMHDGAAASMYAPSEPPFTTRSAYFLKYTVVLTLFWTCAPHPPPTIAIGLGGAPTLQ